MPGINTELSGDPNQAELCNGMWFKSMEDLLPIIEREGLWVEFQSHPHDLCELNNETCDMVKAFRSKNLGYVYSSPHVLFYDQGKGDVRAMLKYVGDELTHALLADTFNQTLDCRPIANSPWFNSRGKADVTIHQHLMMGEGDVAFPWSGQASGGKRADCFDDGAEVCARHVPRNTRASLRADALCEVFAVSTENEKGFPARFYDTEAIRNVTFCAEICGGTCERKVTAVFDDVTVPYSNLVLGEPYPLPGKWCGYPPHEPQPEVYYYRVDRPEGFGFCCVGDNVYKIKDRSFPLPAHGAMRPR